MAFIQSALARGGAVFGRVEGYIVYELGSGVFVAARVSCLLQSSPCAFWSQPAMMAAHLGGVVLPTMPLRSLTTFASPSRSPADSIPFHVPHLRRGERFEPYPTPNANPPSRSLTPQPCPCLPPLLLRRPLHAGPPPAPARYEQTLQEYAREPPSHLISSNVWLPASGRSSLI